MPVPADARSPVTKALRLLTHLAAASEPLTLADISRTLKMPKPTTHRLARSIEGSGFVHQDPLTRRYSLGHAFDDLALNALRHGTGNAGRRLLMNALAERIGARINLVVLKAGNLSFVQWVESTAPLRIDFSTDTPMPVHCTASGKLLLAFGSKELQEHMLAAAPFRSYTRRTITSAAALARELKKIRRREHSEDDQELLAGVNCLAVPIRNRHAEVVAGLAVLAPAASLPLEKLRAFLPHVRACADSIGKELGWDMIAPAQPAAPRARTTRRDDGASRGKPGA